MEPSLRAVTAAERRVASVPWEALAGLSESLDRPIAEVLAGKPAERVLDRLLRALGPISGPARTAVAEAVFGVGLWRRRLLAQLAIPDAPPRLLLASLVRDLGEREDAAALCALEADLLPPRVLAPEALADRYSLPDWLATELLHRGADCHLLADALCQPGPISLRPNLLRTTSLELAARLAKRGSAPGPEPSCPRPSSSWAGPTSTDRPRTRPGSSRCRTRRASSSAHLSEHGPARRCSTPAPERGEIAPARRSGGHVGEGARHRPGPGTAPSPRPEGRPGRRCPRD